MLDGGAPIINEQIERSHQLFYESMRIGWFVTGLDSFMFRIKSTIKFISISFHIHVNMLIVHIPLNEDSYVTLIPKSSRQHNFLNYHNNLLACGRHWHRSCCWNVVHDFFQGWGAKSKSLENLEYQHYSIQDRSSANLMFIFQHLWHTQFHDSIFIRNLCNMLVHLADGLLLTSIFRMSHISCLMSRK